MIRYAIVQARKSVHASNYSRSGSQVRVHNNALHFSSSTRHLRSEATQSTNNMPSGARIQKNARSTVGSATVASSSSSSTTTSLKSPCSNANKVDTAAENKVKETLQLNHHKVLPLSEDHNSAPLEESEMKLSTTSRSAKVIAGVKGAVTAVVSFIRNPKESWVTIKEVINHYWIGSKLLWSETKVAYSILMRLAGGSSLTRREHIQLMRTSGDILRLVPFSVFIIVPFMELLLPFALKLFPNMLPSTFQDNLKKEENLKKELKMRISVAKFLQETLHDMASKKRKSAGIKDSTDSSNAREVLDFIEKVKLGESLNNEKVISIARLFKDELTLSNVGRPQLVSMCRYMGLQPYGTDAFLRFQLRNKLRSIKEDDRRILWEGVNSLDLAELKDACRTRGMRSFGLSQPQILAQLTEWLDLSIQKEIPIMLLIMSRAFGLSPTSSSSSNSAELTEQSLARSMSSLDPDTINEVVVAAASQTEEDTADIRQRKLDSLRFQKEMIQREEDAAATSGNMKTTAGAVSSNSIGISSPATSSGLSGSGQSSSSSSSGGGGSSNKNTSSVPGPEIEYMGAYAEPPSVMRSISTEKQAALAAERIVATAAAATSDNIAPVNDDNGSKVDSRWGVVADVAAEVASELDSVKHLKLTYDEIEALGDLAQGSTVYHERTELAKMQAKKVEEDATLDRLGSVISSMLNRLEIKIDTTEKALGDKMELLDSDNDGKLSTEEIQEAVVKILKRPSSVEEAEELVRILDQDRDGQVSVVDLMQFIKSKKRPAPN